MTARRLLAFLLEGLGAIQAMVPGGHILPPPEKTVPTTPERQLSWTATP